MVQNSICEVEFRFLPYTGRLYRYDRVGGSEIIVNMIFERFRTSRDSGDEGKAVGGEIYGGRTANRLARGRKFLLPSTNRVLNQTCLDRKDLKNRRSSKFDSPRSKKSKI